MGAAAWSRARGGDRGCLEGRAGIGRTERGAPPRGLGRRGSGLGVPGETRAAVPGARRAEAWRGAAERGPAGRGDALGARRACAGVGRLVGVGAFRGPGRDAALATAAPLRAGVGARAVGARGADEVWESEKDRVPGEEKCAGDERDLPEQACSPASRSRLHGRTPLAAAGELFWATCCFPQTWGPRLPGRRAGRWSWGERRGCLLCELRPAAREGLSALGRGPWSETGYSGKGEE